MAKASEQRSEQRLAAALPVKLGRKVGLTRDISVSGISFEVDASYKAGSAISFEVEMETSGEKLILKCQGRIVRTETRGHKTGVAVKITRSVMESAS